MYELYMDAVDKNLSELDQMNDLVMENINKLKHEIRELEPFTTEKVLIEGLRKTNKVLKSVKYTIKKERNKLDDGNDWDVLTDINFHLHELRSQIKLDERLLKHMDVKTFKELIHFTQMTNMIFHGYINAKIYGELELFLMLKGIDPDNKEDMQEWRKLKGWNDKVIVIDKVIHTINKRNFGHNYRKKLVILETLVNGLLADIHSTSLLDGPLDMNLSMMKSELESYIPLLVNFRKRTTGL